MYAIIRAGGVQHRVSPGQRITLNRLAAEPGSVVAFDDVLMLAEDGRDVQVGDGVPGEARVFGRVLEHLRGPKLIIFRKRRRKNSRRTRGHRQDLTDVEIIEISASGEASEAAAEAPVPNEAVAPVDAVATEEEAALEPVLQD